MVEGRTAVERAVHVEQFCIFYRNDRILRAAGIHPDIALHIFPIIQNIAYRRFDEACPFGSVDPVKVILKNHLAVLNYPYVINPAVLVDGDAEAKRAGCRACRGIVFIHEAVSDIGGNPVPCHLDFHLHPVVFRIHPRYADLHADVVPGARPVKPQGTSGAFGNLPHEAVRIAAAEQKTAHIIRLACPFDGIISAEGLFGEEISAVFRHHQFAVFRIRLRLVHRHFLREHLRLNLLDHLGAGDGRRQLRRTGKSPFFLVHRRKIIRKNGFSVLQHRYTVEQKTLIQCRTHADRAFGLSAFHLRGVNLPAVYRGGHGISADIQGDIHRRIPADSFIRRGIHPGPSPRIMGTQHPVGFHIELPHTGIRFTRTKNQAKCIGQRRNPQLHGIIPAEGLPAVIDAAVRWNIQLAVLRNRSCRTGVGPRVALHVLTGIPAVTKVRIDIFAGRKAFPHNLGRGTRPPCGIGGDNLRGTVFIGDFQHTSSAVSLLANRAYHNPHRITAVVQIRQDIVGVVIALHVRNRPFRPQHKIPHLFPVKPQLHIRGAADIGTRPVNIRNILVKGKGFAQQAFGGNPLPLHLRRRGFKGARGAEGGFVSPLVPDPNLPGIHRFRRKPLRYNPGLLVGINPAAVPCHAVPVLHNNLIGCLQDTAGLCLHLPAQPDIIRCYTQIIAR